jgi:ABC-type amino acid transport substrate-binding protein
LSIGVSLASMTPASADEALRFAVLESPIWAETPAEQPPGGVEFDVVRAILDRAGVHAEIIILPLGRILAGGAADRWSFAVATRNQASVASGVVYLAKIVTIPTVIVARKGLVVRRSEDLAGLGPIASIRNLFSDRDVQGILPITFEQVPSTENGLRMLAAGRVNAVISTVLSLDLFAMHTGNADLLGDRLTPDALPVEAWLVASKDAADTQAARALAEAVEEMAASGTTWRVMTNAFRRYCKLRVGWEPDPPYATESNGAARGIDIAILRAVAERAGCWVEAQELLWPQVIHGIETGTIDVAMGAHETAKQNGFALFSKTYRGAQIALFLRADEASQWRFEEPRNLLRQDFSLGVVRGSGRPTKLGGIIADLRAAKVNEVESIDQGLQMLARGEIDGLVGDRLATASRSKGLGLDRRIVVYPKSLCGERNCDDDARFMFSRRTIGADLLKRIDAAIDDLTADGTLPAILTGTN